ncbi:unnamed protein product [Cuscuta campestris]|uniref:MATH domain-containing protein n=1 Tax=Cuscuta campestris TaxID=132261 RepID=A0A484NPI3_9ASTE|nr:unnamed protein product [Cuscuta campestris]
MDNLMTKFTWRIGNFSLLEAKDLYSLTFVVNENKWRLLLYPKGSNKDQHLSMYLRVADSYSLPAEWSIPTKFRISIVNQIDPNKTVKKELEHAFKSGKNGWGWPSFMELSKFHDKSEGYLVEDTCLIEAEVDISSASKDIDSDSSVAIDPIECLYIEAQSFLESLVKAPCSLVSKAPTSDSKHETAVMDSLSTLTDHLYLFSDGQVKEIVKLKATFPGTMQEWRDLVQAKDTSEHPWSTFEKAKSLLQESLKTEEGIKIELGELNKQETDLEAQVVALESNSRKLKEEREEISKQMMILCSLAKEKATKIY